MEIKDVKLPLQLQRAMAAEAEASREARAKVSFIISPECTKLWKGRVETSTEVPSLILQHLQKTQLFTALDDYLTKIMFTVEISCM